MGGRTSRAVLSEALQLQLWQELREARRRNKARLQPRKKRPLRLTAAEIATLELQREVIIQRRIHPRIARLPWCPWGVEGEVLEAMGPGDKRASYRIEVLEAVRVARLWCWQMHLKMQCEEAV